PLVAGMDSRQCLGRSRGTILAERRGLAGQPPMLQKIVPQRPAVSSASSVTVGGLLIFGSRSIWAPYTRLYSFKLTSRPSSLSIRESIEASHFKTLSKDSGKYACSNVF